MYQHRHVTVIIPVLNEAPSIAENCGGTPTSMVDQIIVGDNGSTDDSAAIATACGAMVVSEPERGYGAACLAALAAPVDKDIKSSPPCSNQ